MTPVDTLIAQPGFFDDPYPAYAALRADDPVAWSDTWGGWVITRYADVAAILRDPERFSSAGRVQYILDRLPASARSRTALLQAHYRVGIAHMDPPDHTRLRALLSPWFTPRQVEALRPRIRTLSAQLVDSAVERAAADGGRVDLMQALAYPLPAIVVLEMLGAPVQDADQLRTWALAINLLFSGGGRAPEDRVEQAQAALTTMRAYIANLIAERRARPSDDLIGRLVAAEGERLSDDELVSTCVTLFVAGHETTTNLLGNGLVALLRNPQAMALLRVEPLRMDAAVEEMLRYDPPVHRSWRIAGEDVALRGRQIRRGDMVLLMIGAAHRDPAAFAEPDRFQIARSFGGESKHMGFGLGIHFCLGAPLARIEVSEALHALLARMGRMALATEQPLRWRRDVALRGVEELVVEVAA